MRWIVPLIVFLLCAVLGHVFVLTSIPSFIMGKAHQTFEAQGIPQNVFVASPRQTPQTQRIVRPSPDLAYAICRFDTTRGPVFITAPIGDGYGSLSIFNAQTDNVFVADLSPGSDFTGIEVRRPAENNREGALKLDGRGIALIRRLAPTQVAYDRAANLVADASCAPVE
ncbi:MAG: DUF1254 domain-containing protein [Hyphomonadaceae bacterium]|nr:DUF1254 domain-containing protein [Hyphomonadaceae bacterium]